MRNLGNLDNMPLGMGLKAKPSQLIGSQHAGLDGYGEQKSVKLPLGIFGTLLLIFLIYKVTR